jgi:hypothetical protein
MSLVKLFLARLRFDSYDPLPEAAHVYWFRLGAEFGVPGVDLGTCCDKWCEICEYNIEIRKIPFGCKKVKNNLDNIEFRAEIREWQKEHEDDPIV